MLGLAVWLELLQIIMKLPVVDIILIFSLSSFSSKTAVALLLESYMVKQR